MKLELSADEALVLFEWRCREEEKDFPTCDDRAAARVLLTLQARLEETLVEPFYANYREPLDMARARIGPYPCD